MEILEPVVVTDNKYSDARKCRLCWIDIAKGICIISVIAGHLGIKEINNIVYSYHLTVFFILSGYTMKIRKIDGEFVNKRFLSYMKPYFITCFFVMIGDLVNNIFLKLNASIDNITSTIGNDFIRSFFASGTIKKIATIQLPGRIGAIWFLPALFFAVIIVQTVLYYVESNSKRCLITILFGVVGVISKKFIWIPFSIQSGMLASIFILTGYYIKQFKVIEKLNLNHLLIFFMISTLGIKYEYSLVYFVSAFMKDYLISFIVAIASSIIIIFISKKIKNCRVLEFIGRNSLYYLCVHLFGLEVMNQWYSKYIGRYIVNKYAYASVLFVMKMIFITLVVIAILHFSEFLKKKDERYLLREIESRVFELDIMKGILILLMIIGHFKINESLRGIVYSIHMPAFILMSGYFYRNINLKIQIKKDAKRLLIPYIVFCVVYMVLNVKDLKGVFSKSIQLILGISYSKNIFESIKSVGPVYFILLLFCLKLIYNITAHIFEGKNLHIAILTLSILGFILGKNGWWLPWSLDIALYALVFYHIGFLINQYKILERVKKNPTLYFPLSLIWAYMIYEGSMEIAIRNYGDYLIVVMGAVAGYLLLYSLCSYIINARIFVILKMCLISIGQSTMWILIIHTVFNGLIIRILSMKFNPNYIYSMVGACIIEVIVGVLINKIHTYSYELIYKYLNYSV